MWHERVRRGDCIGFSWRNRREIDHLGDVGVDKWIILGMISRRRDIGKWTGLGCPRIYRWRTLVSAVIILRVPWNEGNFLTSCKPVSISWRTLHHGVINSWEDSSVLGNTNINDWEVPYDAAVSVLLFFPVLSAGGCQSMCVVSLSVVLRCAVSVCSRFSHCIDCRLFLYCWLGLYVCCVKQVLSLYCGCSLQGTCTVDWSYIAYCHSSTVSVLCYLL